MFAPKCIVSGFTHVLDRHILNTYGKSHRKKLCIAIGLIS